MAASTSFLPTLSYVDSPALPVRHVEPAHHLLPVSAPVLSSSHPQPTAQHAAACRQPLALLSTSAEPTPISASSMSAPVLHPPLSRVPPHFLVVRVQAAAARSAVPGYGRDARSAQDGGAVAGGAPHGRRHPLRVLLSLRTSARRRRSAARSACSRTSTSISP